MKPKVYLAGPIAGLTYDGGNDWREDAIAALREVKINGFSPLRGKEYLRANGTLHNGSYAGNPLSTSKGLTTRDRHDVRTADLVLANLTGALNVSIGTMIELGWADAYRVPIILVMEEPVTSRVYPNTQISRLDPEVTKNLHDHAMVRELAGFIVPTLDEALGIVCRILLP